MSFAFETCGVNPTPPLIVETKPYYVEEKAAVVVEEGSDPKERISFAAKERLSIYATALSFIRYTANATKTLYGIHPSRYLFGSFRLVALIPIALTVESLARTIFNTGKDCMKAVKLGASEAIDTALNIIGSIGSIGGNISTFADGLAAVSLVTWEVVKWSTPLLFVSMGLEAVGMIYHVKACVENYFLTNKLTNEAALHKTEEQYTLEDYKKGVALIENECAESRFFVGKQFDVDADQLLHRLHVIESEAKEKMEDPQQKAAAQKLMHSSMHTLKDHLITTRLSHQVSLVAITVGIVATVLLFVPPAVPAGFTLLAIGSVGSIADMIRRKIATARFEQALQL